MPDKTFAQTVFESAVRAADGEAGARELKGHSRDQFVACIRAVTSAMDTLPVETSLHVMLLAVTYLRNVLIVTMQDNQKVLDGQPGGSA